MITNSKVPYFFGGVVRHPRYHTAHPGSKRPAWKKEQIRNLRRKIAKKNAEHKKARGG